MNSNENNNWYTWYPGMEEKINRFAEIIRYKVFLIFEVLSDDPDFHENVITLHMGQILCTGYMKPEAILYDTILDMIKNNEESLKKDTLSLYLDEYDSLLTLERSILPCS